MNCYFHPTEHAVAQCVDCHKALCHRCASKYAVPICENCNRKYKVAECTTYIKPIIICTILYIIGYNIEIFGPDNAMGGYMCMSIYAGWKIIDQFLPNLFIWFNIRAIFWYYLIRIAISMLIGAIATPIYLIYCVIRLIHIVIK